jgi:hypothetical protein
MIDRFYDFFTDEQETAPVETAQEKRPEDASHKTLAKSPQYTTGGGDEKLSEDDADTRLEVDRTYWPYAFSPRGDGERIGTDQILEGGVTSEGEDDLYAGQWVREMFEAHEIHDDGNTWVGYTHDNVKGVQEAGIEYRSLFRHMAFFGVTGYGKSTVLVNIMVQWAYMGHGFCYIDPKGQDIKELIACLPESRLDDIVWVEPGNESSEYSVGFNFFDTSKNPGEPGHENEVDEIVGDFIDILAATVDGWGAIMETVAKAIATQLVRHPYNFTILDQYKIINDKEERERFAQVFGDEVEQVFLDQIAQYEPEELQALNRRFDTWTSNRVTRSMVAQRETSVNISDIVKDGKILLVKMNRVAKNNMKSLIATTIVRRIWATIRSRADEGSQNSLSPYFIVMDEFDMLAPDKPGAMGVGDMLSKGRSLRLGLCLANQQPHQLHEDLQRQLANVDNLFTFAPGQNPGAASELAKLFGIDMMDIMELEKFELLGRVQVGGKKTSAILVKTFAPYPPRRTPEEVEAVIARSQRKYGAKTPSDNDDIDMSEYGLAVLNDQETDDDTQLLEFGEGQKIPLANVLEAVHTAGIRHGTEYLNSKKGWTNIDNIRKEITKYNEDITDGVALDSILEQIPTTLLDEAAIGDTVYYRLTTEGQNEAFVQRSGESSSAGKAGHRNLLRGGYEAFTKLGYTVTIPTQEGEQPDGIATPPIQPMKDSKTFEEAQKLTEKLEREHSRLYDLFKDSTVSLEAESTTLTKPKQTIKNLAKATNIGNKCAFLVKDATSTHGNLEHWARLGHNILSAPAFVSHKDGDGNRKFYNYSTDAPLKLNNGGAALRKAHTTNTVWRDDGDRIVLEDPENKVKHTTTSIYYTYSYANDGSIILRDPDGNEYNQRFDSWSDLTQTGEFEETNIPLAIFKNYAELEEPSHTKFPFNYEYNRSTREYEVRDGRGNIITTYTDKAQMEKDYDIIPRPLIPEEIFTDGTYPSESDWLFIIIPDEGVQLGPQIYRGEDTNGNPIFEPLFEGDDTYDPDNPPHNTNTDPTNPTPDTDTENTDTNTNTTTPEQTPTSKKPRPAPLLNPTPEDDTDTEDTNTTHADPTPPTSNRSTNEIVKQSSEIWTKPESGDDDYDPTKDNTNYRTGYREPGMAENYDGGLARDEDDGSMKDYETPEEKRARREREEYAREKGINPTNDE